MWSFGCIVAELLTGYPIFPGENEQDQLGYIMEIYGVPNIEVLDIASRKHLFFGDDDTPLIATNSKGKTRIPNSKTIEKVLKCNDPSFIDFLNRCFEWHPCDRITPLQAL